MILWLFIACINNLTNGSKMKKYLVLALLTVLVAPATFANDSAATDAKQAAQEASKEAKADAKDAKANAKDAKAEAKQAAKDAKEAAKDAAPAAGSEEQNEQK
jgi:hypothetical protein